jgi:ABC-type sugar transport system substrate-binding protein
MDGMEPIHREIQACVIDASAATIPTTQGAMAILMLWQTSQGCRIPQKIDTGIDLITAENVGRFIGPPRRN